MDGQISGPITTEQSQASQRLKVDTEGTKKRKEILKRKLKNY